MRIKKVTQIPRIFGEEIKRQSVKEYESGKMSVLEISRYYNVSTNAIYKWIRKYSQYEKNAIQVVEMKDSKKSKFKVLEDRIKELEQAVGKKQMKIDFLEKMVDITKEEFGIDLKKKWKK